jgi:energy-coupling factor transporter transmembrane protein EcfT
MSKNTSTQSGGIGFIGLLTIVFITLKLTGSIYWSWLWVLSPIWIPLAIVIVVVAAIYAAAFLVVAFEKPIVARLRRKATRNA